MAEPTVGVVVAHGELAEALVRAVEGISGIEGALVPVSNADCTPEVLQERVREAAGDGPALVFADMSSGSCAFAGLRAASGGGRVAVVTGVSLPMLLDFVFHREMELEPLAERVVRKGRAAASVRGPSEPGSAGREEGGEGDA